MGGKEIEFVNEVFDTNWIAPLGPNLDGFEREISFLDETEHNFSNRWLSCILTRTYEEREKNKALFRK